MVSWDDFDDDQRNKLFYSQIACLKSDAEKLKEELRAYQINRTEQVEAYSTDIREQREKLEDLWKSVNDAIRTSHDSDVITGFKDTHENVEGSLNLQYRDQPELSRMVLSKSSLLLVNIKNCINLRISDLLHS